MAKRRKRRRLQLIYVAGGACVVCGSENDLEFDHRDPKTKSFNLSGKWLDGAWATILDELAKCDLLCHLHHREKTVLKGEIGGGQNKGTAVQVCGTAHAYDVFRCRCERCVEAKKQYRKKLITFRDVVV